MVSENVLFIAREEDLPSSGHSRKECLVGVVVIEQWVLNDYMKLYQHVLQWDRTQTEDTNPI